MRPLCSISELQNQHFSVSEIHSGPPRLRRSGSTFETLVSGDCTIIFESGVDLKVGWQASGKSIADEIKFNVVPNPAIDPYCQAGDVVDDLGAPLAWSVRADTLFQLIGTMDWQSPIRDVLAACHGVGDPQ
jgi:hypothetical protein